MGQNRTKPPSGESRSAQRDPPPRRPADTANGRADAIARLEREILAMRRYLLGLVTQQEAATEQLRAANEAVLNANSQLLRMNEDLALVLAGVDLPLIVVDGQLTVRRFTERAAQLLGLGEGDIGLPIPEAAVRIGVPELVPLVHESISKATPTEHRVHDRRGRVYRVCITPCAGRTGSVKAAMVVFLEADAREARAGEPGL